MIDSHAHICDARLVDFQKEIIDNMSTDGLSAIIEIGADFESSQKAVELACNNKNVFAVVGTHPDGCKEFCQAHYDYYTSVGDNSKVVGIGEIGLDYYYGKDDILTQKKVFEQQLQLSIKVKLPVVLHIRDAYKDALDILKDYRGSLNSGILLHCYSSSAEMVKEFDKLGCYFALGGVITFKNAKKDDVIKAIPLDRLLVETDCPYMSPTPFRGQVNQPKNVRYVAEKIAEVLNISLQDVESLTEQNTCRLFSKMQNG